MKIQLSDHFTYKMLLRFVLPSIIMMVFTSIYGVVDGLFVSNFVGKTPFAAVNLVMPFIMVFGGIGFMFGTGGSALVAKTIGEGDKRRANQYFTMMMVTDVSECNVSVGDLAKQMESAGQEMRLSIRVQREDIFEAMHHV